MNLDINQYGQFSGGNSFVTFGEGVCVESRLYPNNAYYRFNKLRDEGDWPSDISGIYYGKGDCINCPKSHLKNFKDYSWKDDSRLDGSTNQQTLQNNKVTDINQFLMLNSKVGTADIHYKFVGPAFQRLIVGYQVFWPMQGYQNPSTLFRTDRVSGNMVGFISSPNAANNPGVGEWPKEYTFSQGFPGYVSPWGQMQRKIMGDYHTPSQIPKINMGAWFWPEKNKYFQWYINSNFNGAPKISGFQNGLNKKFSELRIIFDSCSVSNIENRVRVPCPSPGSHIFGGQSLLANSNLKYRFHPSDKENRGLFGCFIEYFALIFTDKEKNSLNVTQTGIVEATNSDNFYDVNDASTFNDLLQQYGLSIQGGSNISGEANIEITGFGLPRGVNINLCSDEYFSDNLNSFMMVDSNNDQNKFFSTICNDSSDSIYSPGFDKFSGINTASGLEQSWSHRKGLWTSGQYLDPPFYNGGFLSSADANYMGLQSNFFGTVKRPSFSEEAGLEVSGVDLNFYPTDVVGDGLSSYTISNGTTGWFCRVVPAGTSEGYVIQNNGYIPAKWIYLRNAEFTVLGGLKLFIPINPLYFIHGFAGALLTPFDNEAAGGGYVCGQGTSPVLNEITNCNSGNYAGDRTSYVSNNTIFKSLLNIYSPFSKELGTLSVGGYLENPSVNS